MNSVHKRSVLGVVALLFFALMPFRSCWAGEKNVGVLISQEIAPFVFMVEGLESELKVPVQRFFLDVKGRPYSLGVGEANLNPLMFDVLVAVGPDALQYLYSEATERPIVYGMVLNPDKVLGHSRSSPCGVSLNIPADAQFSSIIRYIPALKRLGVLFDPENNQVWFDNAQGPAASMGFELVPLQVKRQEGKLGMVGDFAGLDALLFIPDKSIISKAVIQYVIKQGFLHKTPVIGYNQFFYDSGAALSFLIDYRKVGRQVARQVQLFLAGEKCEGDVAPQFETVINDDVWRALKRQETEDRRQKTEDKKQNMRTGWFFPLLSPEF